MNDETIDDSMVFRRAGARSPAPLAAAVPSTDTGAPLSQEAFAMLSQANLLRIRGLWQEAIEKCMIAMQLSPGSAAAQSLLGDIYENMGKTADAIRWYELALDANPASIADRNKLDKLKAELRAAHDVPVDPTVTGTLHVTPSAQAPTAAALVLRVASILSTLAVAVVVVVALSRTPQHFAAAASSVPNISSDPILAKQTDQTQGGDTIAMVRDVSEQSLLLSLVPTVDAADGSTKLVDAQSDPRSDRITVTLLMVQPDANPLVRDAILRAAASAALALQHSSMTMGYSDWTVRVLIQAPTGAPAISYIGDSSRASLALTSNDLSGLNTQQVEALFSNEWWAPGVSAPTPPATPAAQQANAF